MRFPLLRSRADVSALVQEIGFLPFFANGVTGFSIEECIAPEYWFGENDGPWEWKGPIIQEKRCAYGKLFAKKAGFVSLDWFADLANYRRDGYDFEGRCEDGLVYYKDQQLMEYLAAHGSCLSRELKRAGDYRKGGNTGFDAVATRLQMQTFLTVQDFEYDRDAYGRPFGWGVARFAIAEQWLGETACHAADARAPEESLSRILKHLQTVLPGAEERQLLRLLRA